MLSAQMVQLDLDLDLDMISDNSLIIGTELDLIISGIIDISTFINMMHLVFCIKYKLCSSLCS